MGKSEGPALRDWLVALHLDGQWKLLQMWVPLLELELGSRTALVLI